MVRMFKDIKKPPLVKGRIISAVPPLFRTMQPTPLQRETLERVYRYAKPITGAIVRAYWRLCWAPLLGEDIRPGPNAGFQQTRAL
ncbi:MAG: hypothetical protein JWR03_2047 [Cohnella sp.]|jgi:hypothetical protein|nr:hypothetical protein [Cohnella sp.]